MSRSSNEECLKSKSFLHVSDTITNPRSVLGLFCWPVYIVYHLMKFHLNFFEDLTIAFFIVI